MRELDDVVDYLVERVENDMPVYRKGLRVNIAKLIDEQLLPKHLVSVIFVQNSADFEIERNIFFCSRSMQVMIAFVA